jgi:hypothetical protein
MQKFIAFAYQLLRAAGSESSRLDFVHDIFRMVQQEMVADETDLFFYHDQKLYRFMVTEQPTLRFCKNNPLAHYQNTWNKSGISFNWLPGFFSAYCDSSGLEGWIVNRQGNCHHFEIDPEFSDETKAYTSILIVPFIYQHDKMGLVVFKKLSSSFDHGELPVYEALGQALSEAFDHQHAHHACKERVKELSCLYEISRLAGLPNLKKEEILQRIAMMMPSAMQYPEIATARINLDQQTFISGRFHESEIRLSADIVSEKMRRGTLEIFYLAKKNDFYDDIFLKEEEKLIQTVSNQVALLIERKESEELSQRLQNQLLHADRWQRLDSCLPGSRMKSMNRLVPYLGLANLSMKTILMRQPEKMWKK